jgi:hypothetical protein
MLNFLPQKNKNEIVSEYLLRLSFFLLLFIFLSSIILISLFAPTFFYAKIKDNAFQQQFASVEQENASKGVDPVAFVKNVNVLATSLALKSDPTDYSDIINKIVSLKNKDIKILSISISEDTPTTEKILLNGIAGERDSLTDYENALETDGFFNSISFPVTDFIQDSNSGFFATLIYKNK